MPFQPPEHEREIFPPAKPAGLIELTDKELLNLDGGTVVESIVIASLISRITTKLLA
jgi:hypothetical protein